MPGLPLSRSSIPRKCSDTERACAAAAQQTGWVRAVSAGCTHATSPSEYRKSTTRVLLVPGSIGAEPITACDGPTRPRRSWPHESTSATVVPAAAAVLRFRVSGRAAVNRRSCGLSGRSVQRKQTNTKAVGTAGGARAGVSTRRYARPRHVVRQHVETSHAHYAVHRRMVYVARSILHVASCMSHVAHRTMHASRCAYAQPE